MMAKNALNNGQKSAVWTIQILLSAHHTYPTLRKVLIDDFAAMASIIAKFMPQR